MFVFDIGNQYGRSKKGFYINSRLKTDKDLRGWFLRDKAEDEGLPAQVEDDNEAYGKKGKQIFYFWAGQHIMLILLYWKENVKKTADTVPCLKIEKAADLNLIFYPECR